MDVVILVFALDVYQGFRDDMMTSSNGNIFRVTGHLCGEFNVPGEFPAQRAVTRSFDVFFDLRLNKKLSKQSWGWWFETLSCPLWRQCNGMFTTDFSMRTVVINSLRQCTLRHACSLHIAVEAKWPSLSRQRFYLHFLERKCMNFTWDFPEISS